MSKLPSHLFISSTDGHLYDTRISDWSRKPPLRKDYRRTFPRIKNLRQLKATLRNGSYAWPGGYPMYFICGDGEALAFKTVKNNFKEIVSAFMLCEDAQWRVIGCEVNWEDTELYDAHTNEQIESAYGDDE